MMWYNHGQRSHSKRSTVLSSPPVAKILGGPSGATERQRQSEVCPANCQAQYARGVHAGHMHMHMQMPHATCYMHMHMRAHVHVGYAQVVRMQHTCSARAV